MGRESERAPLLLQASLAPTDGGDRRPGRGAVAPDRVSRRVLGRVLHVPLQGNQVHGKGLHLFHLVLPGIGGNKSGFDTGGNEICHERKCSHNQRSTAVLFEATS